MPKAATVLPIRISRGEGLPQQVVGEIRRHIVAGTWKPGSKLPPERELTVYFGVSRSVIREAVSILTAFGVLRSRQGGGVYVCETIDDSLFESLAFILPANPQTLRELMTVRKALEGKAAELAARAATQTDLEDIEMATEGIRKAATIPGKIQTGLEFHHAVARASHNHLLARLVTSLTDLFVASHRVTLQSKEAQLTAVQDHHEICRAIQSRDPDCARRTMETHLDLTEKQLGSLLQGEPPLRHSGKSGKKTI
jgi:GntR family transcriptional repressor for pyruvate dehydrogenase complex